MQCQPSPLEFLSTPSARRATRRGRPGYARRRISIHALREEGDTSLPSTISISLLFLSTPSARRATCPVVSCRSILNDFYPRPPRGGRHKSALHDLNFPVISIHALREEGDLSGCVLQVDLERFLSTPSARRATFIRRLAGACVKNFYPRPPRGGRPPLFYSSVSISGFLSTPSARRATDCSEINRDTEFISIHALREEGDPSTRPAGAAWWYFYPRPPRGGRPLGNDSGAVTNAFLSTPSARRATRAVMRASQAAIVFLSTPSARRATSILLRASTVSKFLSTPSARRATRSSALRRRCPGYFYPRPPRGGRPGRGRWSPCRKYFYPRPPRGGRHLLARHALRQNEFLSTPSARRATSFGVRVRGSSAISIHALREEGDRSLPASV